MIILNLNGRHGAVRKNNGSCCIGKLILIKHNPIIFTFLTDFGCVVLLGVFNIRVDNVKERRVKEPLNGLNSLDFRSL